MSGEVQVLLREIDELQRSIQIKTAIFNQKYNEFNATTTAVGIDSDDYEKFLLKKKNILMKVLKKKNKSIHSLNKTLMDFNNEYNEIIVID